MSKLASFAQLPVCVLALLVSLPALAQSQPQANQSASQNVSVTIPVTILGPKFAAPPPVAKEDVIVFSGKSRLNVTSWVPAHGTTAPLQLAILIDDSVSPSTVGLQFNDLKQFIDAQSKSTSVGIFYAINGTAQTAAAFDTNHQAVAAKLHLPLGRLSGVSPSIYLSLKDLVQKWPATRARRETLVISSGVDVLNPGIQDPYFDSTVDAVQKAGVVVHSIYAGGTRLGSSFRGGISQGKLIQLTAESGGQGFFEGVSTPISFAPYLNQLDMTLRNQYMLTFQIPRSDKKKGELRDIRISMEEKNVKISAPSRVFVPGQ